MAITISEAMSATELGKKAAREFYGKDKVGVPFEKSDKEYHWFARGWLEETDRLDEIEAAARMLSAGRTGAIDLEG